MGGRFVVLWDGGARHTIEPIGSLAAHFADRLTLERLAPFAPLSKPVDLAAKLESKFSE